MVKGQIQGESSSIRAVWHSFSFLTLTLPPFRRRRGKTDPLNDSLPYHPFPLFTEERVSAPRIRYFDLFLLIDNEHGKVSEFPRLPRSNRLRREAAPLARRNALGRLHADRRGGADRAQRHAARADRHARHGKVSIEMAARELRYNYFEQLRTDLSADAILVAHHRDDSVETLLINLIRGTGLHGLQGISCKNGYIIRPLLDVSRSDILDYLNFAKQNYVTDSSNNVDDVTRNKIRLNIIPLLRSWRRTPRRRRRARGDVGRQTPCVEAVAVQVPAVVSVTPLARDRRHHVSER